MVDSTSIRHRVETMETRASGRARRDDGSSSDGRDGPESDSDGGNRKRRPGLGSIFGHKHGEDADKGKKHPGFLGGLPDPFHLPSDAGKGPEFPFPTSKGSPLFPFFGHHGSPPPAAGGAADSDPAPSGAIGPPPEKQPKEDPSPVPAPQVAISEDGPSSSSSSTRRPSNSESRTNVPSSVTPDASAPTVSVDAQTLSEHSSFTVPPASSPTTAGAPSETSTTNITPTPSPVTRGRKDFPLAAAGAIGGTLSFLIVSGIVWGLWFWMRRRQRQRARALPPEWDFSSPTSNRFSPGIPSDSASVTGTTLSITVPQFSAWGGTDGEQETSPIPNPFAHMEDELERDPFAGADLRRGNTKGTVSTMSV